MSDIEFDDDKSIHLNFIKLSIFILRFKNISRQIWFQSGCVAPNFRRYFSQECDKLRSYFITNKEILIYITEDNINSFNYYRVKKEYNVFNSRLNIKQLWFLVWELSYYSSNTRLSFSTLPYGLVLPTLKFSRGFKRSYRIVSSFILARSYPFSTHRILPFHSQQTQRRHKRGGFGVQNIENYESSKLRK